MLLVFLVLIILNIILNLKIKLYLRINNNKFEEYFKIFILQIPIWTIKINRKEKTKNSKLVKKLKQQKKNIFILIKDILKIDKLTIEKLDLNVNICTEDAILTSSLVFLISNTIVYILKFGHFKIDSKRCKYTVNPLYISKKVFEIELNCIISASLIHTIYIVYKNYKKWR